VKSLIFSFLTLLLAIDPFGILPFYLQYAQDAEDQRALASSSVITAFIVGVGFLAIGKTLFSIVGITVEDFQIAGGLLLLALSLQEILSLRVERKEKLEEAGVVPLGTPLIAGPATLTALLVCIDLYGLFTTLFAYILNLALTYYVFRESEIIIQKIGLNGARAMAKVSNLLLAAFAISFIRRGLLQFMK